MNFKSFVIFSASAFAFATQALATTYPFSSAGSIATIYSAAGTDSRLYFQASSGANAGSITEYRVSGTFDVGSVNVNGTLMIAPSSEVGNFTSISAAVLSTQAVAFEEIHVFFVSPTGILSEYAYSGSTSSWIGGTACGSNCVTSLNAQVAYNSPILAAYQSGGSSAFLEVTFVDAKNPGALSQVIKKNGTWSTTIYTLQG